LRHLGLPRHLEVRFPPEVVRSKFDGSLRRFQQQWWDKTSVESADTFLFYKLLTVFGNFFFVVVGIFFFGVGVYLKISVNTAVTSTVELLPIGLLLIGIAIFAISILGLCGAGRENRFILALYILALVIIVLAQVAFIGGGLYERHRLPQMLDEGWEKIDDADKNLLQKEFNCCGFNSSTDAPGSVCPTPVNNQAAEGCEDVLNSFIHNRLAWIIAIGFVLVLIEFLGLVFSCCLFHKIPTREEEDRRLLEEAQRVNRNYA